MEDCKQYIFIDESGDPGFKLEKGSSEYFVIACIIFKDKLEMERTAFLIKDLRRNLGFSDNVEFKFSQSKNEVKINFLTQINKTDWSVVALIINKRKIYSHKLKSDKNKFYNFLIKNLLKYNEIISNAKINIDGSGDREFKRSFKTYLNKELNIVGNKKFTDFKFVDSKKDVLIQMSDMVCGSIRKYYETNNKDKNISTKDRNYKNIIKSHIINEWDFH